MHYIKFRNPLQVFFFFFLVIDSIAIYRRFLCDRKRISSALEFLHEILSRAAFLALKLARGLGLCKSGVGNLWTVLNVGSWSDDIVTMFTILSGRRSEAAGCEAGIASTSSSHLPTSRTFRRLERPVIGPRRERAPPQRGAPCTDDEPILRSSRYLWNDWKWKSNRYELLESLFAFIIKSYCGKRNLTNRRLLSSEKCVGTRGSAAAAYMRMHWDRRTGFTFAAACWTRLV